MASKPRADLSEYLKSQVGISRLYFQPPATVHMTYPCILYKLSNIDQKYADNSVYSTKKRYMLILITEDPDNVYVDRMAYLPMCSFSRSYTADNLHHYVFEIYY